MNGMVEKFNTALGKVIKSARALNKPWKQEMDKYLQNYRSSPHMTTEEAPANSSSTGRTFEHGYRN